MYILSLFFYLVNMNH